MNTPMFRYKHDPKVRHHLNLIDKKVTTPKHEKYAYSKANAEKVTLEDLQKIPECLNFVSWYRNAKCGDSFVYYRGSNLENTHASWKIKVITYKYATKGWVYLVQRKCGLDDYEFIAQKSTTLIKRLIPRSE